MSKKYDNEEKPSVMGTLGAFALVGAGLAASRAVYTVLSDVFDTKVDPEIKKRLNKESEKTDKTEE